MFIHMLSVSLLIEMRFQHTLNLIATSPMCDTAMLRFFPDECPHLFRVRLFNTFASLFLLLRFALSKQTQKLYIYFLYRPLPRLSSRLCRCLLHTAHHASSIELYLIRVDASARSSAAI